jgi:C1A family cysteine protease
MSILLQLLATFALVRFVRSDDARFSKWARQFAIHFTNETQRHGIYRKWLDNDVFINQINSLNLSYTLGHNQFSGMDIAEFRQYRTISPFAPAQSVETKQSLVHYALKESVDWETVGAVSPVKDQGQCGSCWSFSTTGALEGAVFIKTGILYRFSEQQLVDCDTFKNGGKDHGCNGGLMDNAFSWVGKNNGLCMEADYPYVSGTTQTAGTCKTSCLTVQSSDVKTYVDVEPNSDDAFMLALSKQPVSVAIEADQREFQLYQSGVFTGSCGTNLDHGVLAVGYGSDAGVDYYRVKNSWSVNWGEKGYIRLGRGAKYNNGAGQCGILMSASFPVV